MPARGGDALDDRQRGLGRTRSDGTCATGSVDTSPIVIKLRDVSRVLASSRTPPKWVSCGSDADIVGVLGRVVQRVLEAVMQVGGRGAVHHQAE